MKSLIVALMLGGCATLPSAGSGRCDVVGVRPFVSALATADIARVAARRAHARTVRWLAPGTMVTMDVRMDRLNVHLDARNFITGVNCG